jgi:hypothetical protein
LANTPCARGQGENRIFITGARTLPFQCDAIRFM